MSLYSVHYIEIHCIFIFADHLTIDNLGDVLEAVWEARSKWYNIGLKLGTSAGTLDSINKATNQNPEDCITSMIKDWLNNGKPKPTWAALAKALKSPMVGYEHLAEQLLQQVAHTSSPIKRKHSRSYNEGEDTISVKKNKV